MLLLLVCINMVLGGTSVWWNERSELFAKYCLFLKRACLLMRIRVQQYLVYKVWIFSSSVPVMLHLKLWISYTKSNSIGCPTSTLCTECRNKEFEITKSWNQEQTLHTLSQGELYHVMNRTFDFIKSASLCHDFGWLGFVCFPQPPSTLSLDKNFEWFCWERRGPARAPWGTLYWAVRRSVLRVAWALALKNVSGLTRTILEWSYR